MYQDNIYIITHYHRKSILFEKGIELLYNNGFKNILIQETGLNEWGIYNGYCSNYIKLGHVSYDSAMSKFREYSNNLNVEYFLFLDNSLKIGA